MIFNKIFSKQKKGQAGLTLLLTVITMLFVAGLLVMLYALIGGELSEQMWDYTSATATNESIDGLGNVSQGGNATAACDLRNGAIASITRVYLANGTTELIPSGNYSFSGCNVMATNGYIYELLDHNFTYVYTYDADTTESLVANDTVAALADVPDWFPTIIVLTVVVVLILLIVIIIQNLRASGLMGGGGTGA